MGPRASATIGRGAVRIGAVLAVLMVAAAGVGAVAHAGHDRPASPTQRPAVVARSAELGRRCCFTDYMFAFEVTSILILIAMVGAVVLARKREV